MAHLIGLNFHGIGMPQRDLEDGEAPYWLSERQFADILDRVAAAPNPSGFVLTFDDGNLSDYEIALPALRERDLSATFFVLTGRLGQPGSLTHDHVTALVAGGMGIGSHGVAHVAWSGLDAAALDRELSQSRRALEDICGHPVTKAGIPFGQYNARVLRALRQKGYEMAFSSDMGQMGDDAFLRPRTSLRGDMVQAEVEAILAGHLSPGKRVRRAIGMMRKKLLPLG